MLINGFDDGTAFTAELSSELLPHCLCSKQEMECLEPLQTFKTEDKYDLNVS